MPYRNCCNSRNTACNAGARVCQPEGAWAALGSDLGFESGVWLRRVAVLALAAATGAQAQTLQNGGFESGATAPWYPTGGASMQTISTDAHSGTFSAEITNRTQNWNAPQQNITSGFVSGRGYEFSAWVKLLQPSNSPVAITLRIVDGGGERYVRVASRSIPVGVWRRVSDFASVNLFPPVTSVDFYVEGPPPGVSYLVDDAAVVAVDGYDWHDVAQAGINTYRKGDLVVRVVDQDGFPRTDATVFVDQQTRDFRFGSAVAASELGNSQYTDFFLDHFNMATPENAWKWPQIEFFQGFEFYDNADAFFNFCMNNDIRIHGHTVLWAVDQFVPDWAQQLSTSALQQAVDNRVQSIVGRYAGAVDAWDVNNEMLHGSFFQTRLGPNFRAELFGDVAAVDPIPPLFVNDYNIISGNELESYADQIQGLLDQGAQISGIGVQGHYNQAVDPYTLRAQLNRLDDFGLPLRVTEYDYARPGASDAERADSLEAMYRVAFSHPAIQSVSVWGYWAGRHWRGEDAALVEMDFTVNAVGQRLGQLLAEWTTSESGGVNGNGEYPTRVFHGTHDVWATTPDGNSSMIQNIGVHPESGTVTVDLVIASNPCSPVDLAAPRGTLNAADVLAVIMELESDGPNADFDGDGSATVLDLVEALRLYDAGCP